MSANAASASSAADGHSANGPSASAPSAGERVPSLDSLRGISILLVLAGHLSGTPGSPAFANGLHNLGNWGVKFFFVISGFIITKLLVEECERAGAIGFGRFFLRRSAKILPAYFAYVAIIAVFALFKAIELMPGDLLHAATFTMNFHAERGWYLNHTWSLGVEEQFYLCWPLVVLMCRRATLLRVCIAIMVLAPLIRAYMWYQLEVGPTQMTRALPAAVDALAAGALFFLLLNRLRSVWPRAATWGFVLVAAAFVVPAAIFKLAGAGQFYVWGQSVMILLIAATVIHCVLHPDAGIGALFNNPVFVAHGTISYSLYLWQEPFLNTYDPRWHTYFPLNLLLAYICGIASFVMIERPARALILRRFERRPVAPAASPDRPSFGA